ncbi:hypothetical protein [Nonomuraea sp. NPDC003201]
MRTARGRAWLGAGDAVGARLSACAATGVDEVARVPVSTDRDPGGAATLKALSG